MHSEFLPRGMLGSFRVQQFQGEMLQNKIAGVLELTPCAVFTSIMAVGRVRFGVSSPCPRATR